MKFYLKNSKYLLHAILIVDNVKNKRQTRYNHCFQGTHSQNEEALYTFKNQV